MAWTTSFLCDLVTDEMHLLRQLSCLCRQARGFDGPNMYSLHEGHCHLKVAQQAGRKHNK
eukprot:1142049-Pelagomonas_calceolata.AAC.3